jgi:hypothetical protein
MTKTARNGQDFLPAGRFTVGANYWASHAGMHMWRDWRPDVVREDLARLADAGLQVLRVFPLWPDFQPIYQLRTGNGRPHEFRHGEDPLPLLPGNGIADGVAPVMLDRFRTLADLADAQGLTLIIGLITGWMSGRLFVPAGLEGLNPITDPLSLMWQTRLATRLVRDFRDHPAIVAWDLGNECNVMGEATRAQAWVWTATLTGAIRGADPTRPVVSGMHSLTADPAAPWTIRDQAELTDVLTTHPYPLWTPHCDQDVLDSLRPALHAAAETRLYADIGGRPAFAEEIGMMGPMVADEETAAAFARASLFSLWAHDCRAALWWCACDQGHLTHPPYDWQACETELGLLRRDGTPKPALHEIGAMRSAVQALPFSTLPPRRVEAVCVLTPGQDSWGVGQSAFLLAKQAGFELSFAFADSPLPASDLYLLPSLTGLSALTRRQSQALTDRVHAGATLYVSLEDAFLAEFEALTGLLVRARHQRSCPLTARFEAATPGLTWESSPSLRYELTPTRAEVLGVEADGNPLFTRADCGRGRVYFLGFPLEAEMSIRPGIFQDGPAMWRLYQQVAADALAGRALRKSSPQVGITEHPVSDRERIAVLINYTRETIHEEIALAPGWILADVPRGDQPCGERDGLSVALAGMDAAVWRLSFVP